MTVRSTHLGRRFTGLLAFVVLVTVTLAAVGILPVRTLFAQQEAVGLAKAQLEALEAENARLEREIAALGTPGEVERLAREQFGFVRPGEIGYVVVTPSGGVPAPGPLPRLLERDETPWWGHLWSWLTGRDLVDG